MPYSYTYGQPSAAAGGTLFAVAAFFVVLYLLLIAFSIACYILEALGMYTIAKRRGIHNPWLAWLPIGNVWILGSISDQYRYVVKGQVRNRRKVLLGLAIGTVAMVIPFILVYTAFIVNLVTYGPEMEAAFGINLGLVLLLCLAMSAVSITAAVFQYMALYDLFMSCDPGTGVLFLVLSILLGVVLPFFVFCNRNKDLGMPPRQPQIPPVWQQQQAPWQSGGAQEPPASQRIDPPAQDAPQDNTEA